MSNHENDPNDIQVIVKYIRMSGMANSTSEMASCCVPCKPFHNGALSYTNRLHRSLAV